MNLFIIGNGFDIAHNLPTKYKHFRDYLLRTYPGCDEYDELIPEPIMENRGGEHYEMDEVAGYITRIIDSCGGVLWSDLEGYLGDAVFGVFSNDLDEESMDDSDKVLMRAIHRNQDLADAIRSVFPFIKQLFCDWVRDGLGSLNYSGIGLYNHLDVLSDGDAFLSFNYTKTLENVYGIRDVCHIHGVIGDSSENVFFGHGDKDDYQGMPGSIGAETFFIDLKRELLKDTNAAMNKHRSFFNSLADVKSIHSFGFSFSPVDMFYIEWLANRFDGATWFLNSYDSKNKDIRSKLETLGFAVEEDVRW